MTDLFEEVFPYYLSVGMTTQQFWEGDPTLCRAYRKADELRTQRMNSEAWLQGAYFYEALCCASPLYRDFTYDAALPYLDRPYPVTKNESQARFEEAERQRAEEFTLYIEELNRKNTKNT